MSATRVYWAKGFGPEGIRKPTDWREDAPHECSDDRPDWVRLLLFLLGVEGGAPSVLSGSQRAKVDAALPLLSNGIV